MRMATVTWLFRHARGNRRVMILTPLERHYARAAGELRGGGEDVERVTIVRQTSTCHPERTRDGSALMLRGKILREYAQSASKKPARVRRIRHPEVLRRILGQ